MGSCRLCYWPHPSCQNVQTWLFARAYGGNGACIFYRRACLVAKRHFAATGRSRRFEAAAWCRIAFYNASDGKTRRGRLINRCVGFVVPR